MTSTIHDVRKSVTVPVGIKDAFRVFTEHPLEWWPPSHVLIRHSPRVGIAIDREVDGRFYETAEDGTQATWGRILEWDEPNRIVITWRINGKWENIPNDDAASEIEVTFTSAGPHTVVELAHVKLYKHGPDAEFIFQALDGPSPGETLELYALAVARLT